MNYIVNYKSTEKIAYQFWLMVFVFLLPATVFAATVDFNTMLSAMKRNAGPIIIFIGAIAYVMGIWFILAGVMALKKVGESAASQTHASKGGPLIKLLVGVLLIYLPNTLNVSITTLWGSGFLDTGGGSSILPYVAVPGDPFGPAKEGAIAIIRVVGYVSFVRGLVMLSRSADQGAQQGTFGKGFMHIIGGVLAINIVGTVQIISNTLGFRVL